MPQHVEVWRVSHDRPKWLVVGCALVTLFVLMGDAVPVSAVSNSFVTVQPNSIQPPDSVPSNISDLVSQPTTTPGFSNGNFAYLNPSSQGVAAGTSGSTSDGSPSIIVGCSGHPVSIINYSYAPELGLSPLRVAFSVESSCAGASGGEWIFADGNSTSQNSPNASQRSGLVQWWNYTHTYRFDGFFEAEFSFEVIGPPGGWLNVSMPINVGTVGAVSLRANPNYGSPALRVSLTYETVFGSGDSAAWDFGDGNASSQTVPNGTATSDGVEYQWWNYTHTYRYPATFVAGVNVSSTRYYAVDSTKSPSEYLGP